VKYTRIFKDNERPARILAQEFVSKLLKLITAPGEEPTSILVDYYDTGGSQQWLYWTPRFSPCGFITVWQTRVEEGPKEVWKVIMNTA